MVCQGGTDSRRLLSISQHSKERAGLERTYVNEQMVIGANVPLPQCITFGFFTPNRENSFPQLREEAC